MYIVLLEHLKEISVVSRWSVRQFDSLLRLKTLATFGLVARNCGTVLSFRSDAMLSPAVMAAVRASLWACRL